MRIISTAALACHEELYRESLEKYANYELALIEEEKNDIEEKYKRKNIIYMWDLIRVQIIQFHLNQYIKKNNIRCILGDLLLTKYAIINLHKSSEETRIRIKIQIMKNTDAKEELVKKYHLK